MLKIIYLVTVLGCTLAAQSHASLNIQPDPKNPNGYFVEKSALQAAEQAKTSDPMYAIWSQAHHSEQHYLRLISLPRLP